MQKNLRDEILFSQPKSLDQRAKVATEMCSTLKLAMPALIDGLDDKVGKDYSAWPDRLYLIDTQGKIAYKSAPGPAGFKPAELETAIAKLLLAE